MNNENVIDMTCAMYEGENMCRGLRVLCNESENRYTCPFYKPDKKLIRYSDGKDICFREMSRTQRENQESCGMPYRVYEDYKKRYGR